MTDFARAAQRRRRRTLIIAGVALITMVLAVGLAATHTLSGAKKKAGVKTAHGIVSIVSTKYWTADPSAGPKGCNGTGDFTDVASRGTVTISDNVGNVLAVANLQPGTIDVNNFCEFAFDAPNVPTSRGPYGVQITRRKVVQVDEGDLFSLITLTLGG